MIEIVNCPLEEFDEAEILAYQVNCSGRYNSKKLIALRNKYPEVYEGYRNFCKENKHKLLGSVYICDTNDGKTIANLFGQDRYGRVGRYTDYNALNSALFSLANYMKDCGMQSVAFPYKIGCGTGGGDWNLVSKMIQGHFKDFDVYYCKIEERFNMARVNLSINCMCSKNPCHNCTNRHIGCHGSCSAYKAFKDKTVSNYIAKKEAKILDRMYNDAISKATYARNNGYTR